MNILTRFVIIAALLTSLPAWAEVDGYQLLRFQQEADAFNEENLDANRYRAGFFGGYLSGMLDALEGRSVCFRVCRCELDDRVAGYLRDHPDELDKPVAGWLVKLLEDTYPCPK